ncbi:MAG: glycosyltransferase family 4 protein [Candidatus Promineifilaceae bacterium]
MRIGLVTTEYPGTGLPSAGLGSYVQRLSRALIEAGHAPTVVVSGSASANLRDQGVQVVVADSRLRAPLKFANHATAKVFGRSMTILKRALAVRQVVLELDSRARFDILHYASSAGVGLFLPTNRPTVCRLSSYAAMWHAAGDFSHITPLYIWQEKFWERRAICRADTIFAPSQVVADYVSKELNRDVNVIRSPMALTLGDVDPDLYQRCLAGKLYLLHFGRLTLAKGIDIVAQAARPILEAHPNLQLVLCGSEVVYRSGPASQMVIRSAGEHSDRVVYLGKLSQAQLIPIVANAHAVILPSRVDNLPNTCIEAMALGRVVIGTSGTSLDELIEDGRSGFIIQPGSAAELLPVIEHVLSLSSAEVAEIGRQARRRLEPLRPEVVVPKLISFYEEAIDQHSRVGLRATRQTANGSGPNG